MRRALPSKPARKKTLAGGARAICFAGIELTRAPFASDAAVQVAVGMTVQNNRKGDRAMNVEMEVSLYPLAEEYLEYPVHDFVDLLKSVQCLPSVSHITELLRCG